MPNVISTSTSFANMGSYWNLVDTVTFDSNIKNLSSGVGVGELPYDFGIVGYDSSNNFLVNRGLYLGNLTPATATFSGNVFTFTYRVDSPWGTPGAKYYVNIDSGTINTFSGLNSSLTQIETVLPLYSGNSSYFLSNFVSSGIDQSLGVKFALTDTASQLSQNLDLLNQYASRISSITVSDHAPVTVTPKQATNDLAALTLINSGGGSYVIQQPVVPVTYVITGDLSVNEGATDYLQIQTTGLTAGSVINYTVSGIDASRLSPIGYPLPQGFTPTSPISSINNYVTVNDSGVAVVMLQFLNNNHTDGPTTAVVSVANGAATYSVLVNDTSLSPITPINPIDTTAPTVSTFSPPDGATGVPVTTNIYLNFSEEIQRGAGSIYLRSDSPTGAVVEEFNVATSSRLTVSGSSLVIDPTLYLSDGTHYFVTFGSGTVKDLAGNSYAGTSTYDFTTKLSPNLGNPTMGYFGPTGDNIVDATTNGYEWVLGANRTLDFAVANGFGGEHWNNISLVGDYLKLAVEQFSNFANINFNFSGSYLNPTAAYNAGSEITLSVDGVNRFFNSPNTYAMGFFPNSGYNSLYQGAPGDVYLNQQSAANNLPSYLPGSEGWFVLVHELGHTLGLKHPHDDGGTGRPTYSSLGLGRLDIDLASIMSYNDGAALNLIGWDPATPMLLDVYGLQYIYGKNTTINAGDTTFTLLADGFYKTLWDPSGTDTLDASTNSAGWTIHLPNVSLSTLVDTKAGYAAPTADYYASVPHSLTWLMGDFENVTCTSYDDTIDGNSFNNCIICNAGNDTVEAGDGFDTVYGGAGDDYIQGGKNGDKIYGGDGNDDLRAGNGLDSVDGGAGNDTIRGAKGTDTLTGGSGADDFVFATELDGVINIDTITDFTSGVDRIELSVSVFTALAGQIGRNVGLSQNITYNASNGNLSYDADGSGPSAPIVFAVLGTTSHPSSVGTDFWIAA